MIQQFDQIIIPNRRVCESSRIWKKLGLLQDIGPFAVLPPGAVPLLILFFGREGGDTFQVGVESRSVVPMISRRITRVSRQRARDQKER